MIWLTASCSGFAEEPVAPGWKKQDFDFGAPDLRGDIALPSDAALQSVHYLPRQAGTAGGLKVVGKIASSATVPADITVMAFDLEYPAAPLRVCANEAQMIGLDVVSQSVTDDLSGASLRSVQARDGQFEQVAFTRCLTRGTKLLVFHFTAKPAGTGEDAVVKTGKRIETFAATLFKGMTFTDGKPVSHWEGMADIPLKLGERTATLRRSPAWTVAINDFNGAIPAEMHLVRKRNGKDAGLVWLGAFEASAGFDMDRDGQELLRGFMAKQSPDFGEAKLLSNDRLALPDGASGEKHRFHFEIASKSGGEAGDVAAMVAHSGDRLYAVAWWSPAIPGDGRGRFMARLPGMTAYDLAQEAMNGLAGER
uniref:Uncharacterized protein n=1 Tax=Bosea sp. NBC_00436 TaxID=2969620 RepID=A0A9E8CU78_9HYPH